MLGSELIEAKESSTYTRTNAIAKDITRSYSNEFGLLKDAKYNGSSVGVLHRYMR